ncbi:tRNA pseudouridine(38-40) synthase TruA [Bacillaceae bacterium]
MVRIKLTVSYDGTNYHGFQVQPHGKTIQGELERALWRLTQRKTAVVGSGRTDAGVHAKGQVVHFDTDSTIPVDRWCLALNSVLPADIVATDAEEVGPTFHARNDVAWKTYRYSVDRSRYPDVFWRRYAFHVPWPLDVPAMKEAAAHLVGEHDFTSFCSARTEIENKVRTLAAIEIVEENHLLHTYVRGNGFLYNMVRIIMGTLLEVGQGKREPEDMRAILLGRDRSLAGVTAPAHGLTLWEVEYAKNNGTQRVLS